MDIQHLRAFLAIAESESFSEASVSLHVTQPAISKRIAQLEDNLESRLFDRIGRRVTLTEAGKALLPHAQQIMRDLENAAQSVRDLSGTVSGHLRLATSHHIGLHRIPPVLQRFQRETPAVHLEIEFLDSEQAYEAVHQGKAELGVVTLKPDEDERVVAVPIWHDPLVFMVADSHPLAGQAPVLLAELAGYPAVLPGLGTYTGRIVKQLFDQYQLAMTISMATNYLETLRMLAQVGLGWTVLPQSMLQAGLVALPVKNQQIARTLGYIYHSHRSLSRAARAFIAAIENQGLFPQNQWQKG